MDTELAVHDYMLHYQRLMGEPPRMKDIQDHIDTLNYRSSVRHALKNLEDMGLVKQIKAEMMSRRWKAVGSNNHE